jgi:hypothetical protein
MTIASRKKETAAPSGMRLPVLFFGEENYIDLARFGHQIRFLAMGSNNRIGIGGPPICDGRDRDLYFRSFRHPKNHEKWCSYEFDLVPAWPSE